MKILIFIVAYNAEAHIESVLRRIPDGVWNQHKHSVEVLIIDDQSKDATTQKSKRFKELTGKLNLTILSNPVNQGYGGNQKLGYYYAIQNRFDIVILLHGDGQYAPEMLPSFIAAFEAHAVDAVFGSRMLAPRAARQGGMPLYKFIGNRVLTTIQNWLLHQKLSEFHSGYRAYRVSALSELPFAFNSPDFDFDTDIIIQLVDTGKKIHEIPIPTYYGNEICRVNGIKYAAQIISSTIRSRLQRYAIAYHPKFDYVQDNSYYSLKLNQPSSHQWAIDFCIKKARNVLDIGCGPGALEAVLRKHGCYTMGIDQYKQEGHEIDWFHQANLDHDLFDFLNLPREPETILCLDIIEHLKSPEKFLLDLRERASALSRLPEIVITTPNIAFFIIRIGLLFGKFNYGKRGILDLTHTRLFTFSTLKQLLLQNGYEIISIRGIPAPLQLVFGSGLVGRMVTIFNSALTRLWRGLFAYQIFIVTRPLPVLSRLLKDAHRHMNNESSASTSV